MDLIKIVKDMELIVNIHHKVVKQGVIIIVEVY